MKNIRDWHVVAGVAIAVICGFIYYFPTKKEAQIVPKAGAPVAVLQRSILPETTGIYDLGTSSRKWAQIWTNSLTIASSTTGCAQAGTNGQIIFTGTNCGTGSSGGWATSSQNYWESQAGSWKVITASYLTPTTTIGTIVNASSTFTSVLNASNFAAYSTTASSTFNGIEGTNINLSGSATSTAANGIAITSGCFYMQGTCLDTLVTAAGAYKAAVRYASTSTLPSNTYSNGVGGVGATLTGTVNGPFYIDGNTPTVGDRVLVKNEGTGANNGIYTVTTLGVAGLTAFVLTRATDYNSSTDVYPGVANFVNGGTQNANTCWILTNISSVTIGTTALTYADECGAGSFSGTYPIMVTGTTISTAFGTTTNNTFVTGQTFAGASSTDFTASHSFYGSFVNGLAALDVNKLMYSVATSSETCTSPLSCGAHQVLAGGGAITIQNASASQGGAITSTDYQRLYAATTTALFPVTYNPTTNTFTSAFSTTTDTGLSRNGVMYTSNTGTFATAATGTVSAGSTQLTVTANRFVIGGALSIDCATAATAQSGCISSTDWNTFNLKNQNIGATTTNPFMATFYIATSSLVASRFPYASTTAISATASSTFGGVQVTSGGLQVSTLVSSNCDVKSDTSGNIFCGTDNAAAGGDSFTHPSPALSATTSTMIITTGGLIVQASSTLGTYNSTTTILGSLMIGNTFLNGNLEGTTTILQISTSTANYIQTLFVNSSTSTNASACHVLGNGSTTATNFYGEFCFNGMNYTNTNYPTQRASDISLVASDGGIDIGTGSSTQSNASSSIRLYTRGVTWLEVLNTGHLVMGTSSPAFAPFTIASSTAPQLALSDGKAANSSWSFRTIANSFYLATSTAIATSTTAAFSINTNGFGNFPVGVASGSSSPMAALTVMSTNPYLFYIATSTLGSASTSTIVFAVTNYGGVQLGEDIIATSTTMVLDWSTTKQVVGIPICNAALTITVVNATTSQWIGSTKRVHVMNMCSGTAGTITWAGLQWDGDAKPTQKTTTGSIQTYSFTSLIGTTTVPGVQLYQPIVEGTGGTGF